MVDIFYWAEVTRVSRPEQAAVSQSLSKQTSCSMCRQTQKPGKHTENLPPRAMKRFQVEGNIELRADSR